MQFSKQIREVLSRLDRIFRRQANDSQQRINSEPAFNLILCVHRRRRPQVEEFVAETRHLETVSKHQMKSLDLSALLAP